MKKHIKSIVSLTSICAVVSLLLAVTNFITEPIIEKMMNAATNQTLVVVLPSGEDFLPVDISGYTLPDTITEAYSEKNGGYVFKMKTAGYGSDFIIMCGINADGTVAGATCISSNETLGAEAEYGKALVDATLDSIEAVATTSGATRTTGAYKNAVKDALSAFVIIGGGEVDLRTEEEILADNLSAALPDGNGKFTRVFITDELTDISAVYSADNGKGYVFVSGESFIGTDAEGNVISDASDQLKNIISSQKDKVIGITLTEIDITGFKDMPAQITKAYKASNGNYVFDLKAAGYGINGDEYIASGEYIIIKVSATDDGRIVNCLTVSQKETDGIGSACEDESFYSRFNGKDESNYRDIDAISGATITTNGYKTAISKVFEAVKLLKGAA